MLGVSAYLGLSTPYVFTAFILGLADFFIFIMLLGYTYRLGRGSAKGFNLPSVLGLKLYSIYHSVLVSVFIMGLIGLFWLIMLTVTTLTQFVIAPFEAVIFLVLCVVGVIVLYYVDFTLN